MTSAIRQRLQAQPFVPFTVDVTDGRSYEIFTPDHAHVHPGGGRVSVYTDDGGEMILAASLVTGLRGAPSTDV